jgi:hypothetical protein
MEASLTKYGTWLFAAFIILGLFTVLGYDTIQNEPFVFAFNYLTIPVLVIAYTLYFKMFPKYRKLAGDFKGCVWVFFVCSIFILMSQGYLMYINAAFGTQLNTKLEGEIVELNTHSRTKGGTSYYVFINNTATGEVVKLNVSKRHFEGLKEGQYYSETWNTGSLGIRYR